ncbi:MAG: rhomboid family intramembrane serine protease [Synechococcales bacterium]|nr:rhomboid family intramembrane serine protease [Synechococcales bacterium]
MEALGFAIVCIFLLIRLLNLKDKVAESLLYPLTLMLVLIAVSESSLLDVRTQFSVLRDFIFIAFVVHFFNFLCQGGLASQLGIRPRTVRGLFGIVFCPFLHQWEKNHKDHIFGNTAAFITLGWLIILQLGGELFYKLTVCIALLSGAAIWLLGDRRFTYFGASAVTFGFMGFLAAFAAISRQSTALFFAAAAIIAYSWHYQKILQGQDSFGHGVGFVSGITIATLSLSSDRFIMLLEAIN